MLMSSFIMVLKSLILPGLEESKKGNFKFGGRKIDILHMLAVEGMMGNVYVCITYGEGEYCYYCT